MRCLAFVVVIGPALVASCGKDYGSEPDPTVDAGPIVLPDGRVIDPPGPDGSMGDPDGSVPLTDCEEAELHSDLAWLQEKVFTPSCATSSCHAGANPDVGLSLEAGRTHANLVNRNSSTVTGWVRVVPGSIETSYLAVALGRADGPPPRDGFMPIGGAAPLCVEKLEAIERWIVAGAQP